MSVLHLTKENFELVTGEGKSLQHSHFVPFDIECSGHGDLSEHRDLEIHEFHSHHGI